MPHRIARMRIDDVITGANSATGAGAVTGVLGWAASINWLGLTGALIAALGFLISWHYQRKRFRLEEAARQREREAHELNKRLQIEANERARIEHEARMRRLNDGD